MPKHDGCKCSPPELTSSSTESSTGTTSDSSSKHDCKCPSSESSSSSSSSYTSSTESTSCSSTCSGTASITECCDKTKCSSTTDTSSQHKHSIRVNTPPIIPDYGQVKMPNVLDTIFHRTRVPRTIYYFTSGGTNGIEPRDVAKEHSFYSHATDQQAHAYRQLISTWRQREKDANREAGTSKATQMSLDLRARIHVDSDENVNIRGIIDLDPEYYTLVQNRPIRTKFHHTDYVRDVRLTFKTNCETHLLQDEALKNQEYCFLQQETIDNVRDRQEKYSKCFEAFLADDDGSARKELQISDEMTFLTKEMKLEIVALGDEISNLRSELFLLQEHWKDLSDYQKILYRVAPLTWRLEHDWIHRDAEGVLEQDASCKPVVREESQLSLYDLLTEFVNQVAVAPEPLIPFESPEVMIENLDAFADNTLFSLAHLELISGPLAQAKAGADQAKAQAENELEMLRRSIDKLSVNIQWEEVRGQSLKERGMQLIKGGLHKLFVPGPNLATHVWVEDAYEVAVGPNDSNLSTLELARGLERDMAELYLELDTLPLEHTMAAEEQVLREEVTMWENAVEADHALKVMKRLLKSIVRSFAPVPPPLPHQPAKRSPLPPPPPIIPKPAREITEVEQDMLDFFTDWCSVDDIDTYLARAKGEGDAPSDLECFI